jgi:hypothetical protein
MLQAAEISTSRWSRQTQVWIVVAMGAIAARIALSAVSVGSVDAHIWQEFGRRVASDGIIHAYQQDANFNHPPLMGYLAAACFWLGEKWHVSFPFLFRLPPITADAITCILLWRIHSKRKSLEFAALVVALFAWNIAAILISGFHCNTDSMYATLSLLAAMLLPERPMLAGISLGAAINVKLFPVMLILPLAATLRSAGSARKFLGGLALMSLPFIVLGIAAPRLLWRNILAYNSFLDNWGIEFFLRYLARIPEYSTTFGPLMSGYFEHGKWIMLLAIVLISAQIRRRNISPLQAASIAAAFFLILSPAFCITYLIFVAPLLFVTRLWWGAAYAIASSLMTLCWYWPYWNGRLPIDLPQPITAQPPASYFGLAAWTILIGAVCAIFLRTKKMSRVGNSHE